MVGPAPVRRPAARRGDASVQLCARGAPGRDQHRLRRAGRRGRAGLPVARPGAGRAGPALAGAAQRPAGAAGHRGDAWPCWARRGRACASTRCRRRSAGRSPWARPGSSCSPRATCRARPRCWSRRAGARLVYAGTVRTGAPAFGAATARDPAGRTHSASTAPSATRASRFPPPARGAGPAAPVRERHPGGGPRAGAADPAVRHGHGRGGRAGRRPGSPLRGPSRHRGRGRRLSRRGGDAAGHHAVRRQAGRGARRCCGRPRPVGAATAAAAGRALRAGLGLQPGSGGAGAWATTWPFRCPTRPGTRSCWPTWRPPGAREVAVHRGHAEALAAALRAQGLLAYALGPPHQLELFRG